MARLERVTAEILSEIEESMNSIQFSKYQLENVKVRIMKITNMRDHLERLQEQKAELEVEVDQYRAQLDNAQNDLETVEAEIDDLEAEIADLQQIMIATGDY